MIWAYGSVYSYHIIVIMRDNISPKLKLLLIMKILEDETDEDHPCTAKQLCEYLKVHNIKTERKSIYRDIGVLVAYGMDINRSYNKKDGFYLACRDFELSEIQILISAVNSASFLSRKKTKTLIRKLKGLVSRHQTKLLLDTTADESLKKTGNEKIFYTIDAIQKAVCEGRNIRFKYLDKPILESIDLVVSEETITATPVSLIWKNSGYYLEAYKNDNKRLNYQIDRISSIKIL